MVARPLAKRLMANFPQRWEMNSSEEGGGGRRGEWLCACVLKEWTEGNRPSQTSARPQSNRVVVAPSARQLITSCQRHLQEEPPAEAAAIWVDNSMMIRCCGRGACRSSPSPSVLFSATSSPGRWKHLTLKRRSGLNIRCRVKEKSFITIFSELPRLDTLD